jgi:putative flippase GtrA
VRIGLAAQVANLIAFLVNLLAGWVLHSRFSFRGHGYSRSAAHARFRFAAINLAGYGLNALWVWLVVHPLRLPAGWAILPIVTLTPAFNFILNRWLVFRPQPRPDMARP